MLAIPVGALFGQEPVRYQVQFNFVFTVQFRFVRASVLTLVIVLHLKLMVLVIVLHLKCNSLIRNYLISIKNGCRCIKTTVCHNLPFLMFRCLGGGLRQSCSGR